MKWMGIICLFMMSTVIGFYAAGRIKTKYRTTQKLATLLSEFSTQLRYQAAPLEELLEQFAYHPNYSEFTFLREVSNGFTVENSHCQLWEKCVHADPSVLPQAGEILCSLGNILGTTDIQGQLTALEIYQRRMEETAEDLKTNCIRREELYRRLGVLFGAMFSVLLL